MSQEGKINVTVPMDPYLVSIIEVLAQKDGKGKAPYIEDLVGKHVLQKHGSKVWGALYDMLKNEST